MTDTFRALCAELAEEVEHLWSIVRDDNNEPHSLANRARALLAEPVAEGPSNRIASIAKAVQECAFAWEPDARLVGNVRAEDIADLCSAVLARWGRPTPQPPVLADVHYEWELQDADGDWQAGGSANSLDDVRREGAHYLRAYAQDGPHKLIIRQHLTQTIDETTNG